MKLWYVAQCRPRMELIGRDRLQKLGYEAYVATQTERHDYKNRTHRDVERIIISKKIFVHVTQQERLDIMAQMPGFFTFMVNPAGTPTPSGHHPLAIIPDDQMHALQYLLYHANQHIDFTEHPLQKGDRIRVARGSLKGLEGTVIRQDGKATLFVQIDYLGCAAVNISLSDIEKT